MTAEEIRKIAKAKFDKTEFANSREYGVVVWSAWKKAFDLGYNEGNKNREQYAQQEKEKEAVEFMEWHNIKHRCNLDLGKDYLNELYTQFQQEKKQS